MNQIITARRAGAGVATGALVASALLFAPSAQAATAGVFESQIAPNESVYAGWHQGADGGKYKVVNEGLELEGRSQVIKGYTQNSDDDLTAATRNFDITKLPGSNFTVKSGQASLQVPLFVDTDGTGPNAPVFTTLRTPLSATGGEVKLTDQWESSKAFGAVAANTPTDLSAIIDAIKDNPYRVIAFGVYNESGTSVVSDITFDGTTFQFKNSAPTFADKTVSTKINTAVAIPLTANDIDGNALTYSVDSVVGGATTVTGSTLNFTPTRNFKGNASVKVSVNDARGGTASSTVTVKVVKQQGKVEIYRIHPTRPSVRSTVYVYASIMVDGQKAKPGTTIYAYAKGKKVVTAKVNSTGKVKLKLPNKLPAGNATLKVTQVGSSVLNGDSDSIKVRVRK